MIADAARRCARGRGNPQYEIPDFFPHSDSNRVDPPARGAMAVHVREPTRDHTAAAKGLERWTLRRGEASADTSAIAIEAAAGLGQ